MKKHLQKVLLLFDLRRASNRDFIRGIAGFVRKRRDWDLTLVDVTEFPERRVLCRERFEAILTKESLVKDLHDRYGDKMPPTAVFGSPHEPLPQAKDLYYFASQDQAIGHKAALYFKGLGNFACYGYCGESRQFSFSLRRGESFLGTLSGNRFKTAVCDDSSNDATLEAWLSGLPKPAAVFCACDRVAVRLVAACHALKIAIPGQIAVLGVDNDDLISAFISPTLSSIALPHLQLGFQAAEFIHKRLVAGRPMPQPRNPGARLVVHERDSTLPIKPSVHLAERAEEFISRESGRKITPNEVARYLGVSRTLLDLRFRELQKGTVHAAILRERLKTVCTLLKSTSHSIASIAQSCGFGNASWLQTSFKQHLGTTMRAWREAHRA